MDTPNPSTPHGARSSGTSTPILLGSPTSSSEHAGIDESNDVAVVGMGCRVAGGNHSPEQLWESILAKRDASSEIPPMRWEAYRHRDARIAKELERTTKRGYFLNALEDFDAAFFGISPKEAEQMDPQQRLALEVTWEALESAGVNAHTLAGSDTAVFMGVNSDDYGKLLLEDLPNVEAWMGIGTAYCGVPNRISYHLNLQGPSTAVDAACASSLVALHHGRQAILAGESTVAITGGVNALCGPGLTRVLDKAGAISPEGSCLSFDDSAHGYGRGEGAAVVILKRLSAALHDGDHILALLKGTAVAQDGKTQGIMAPNGKAQELVARQALALAHVDPATVDYVEAHATSTPLGDPTEVRAISAVYGSGAAGRASPVMVGSVKPNVGHLEAGAGAVGFVKAVAAVNNARFPPQANLRNLTAKVDWASSGTHVVREAADWPARDAHLRRAAVCSYGYGGTVSHAVIEQSPYGSGAVAEHSRDLAAPGPVVLVLSAPQQRRLAGQAGALAAWLRGAGNTEPLKAVANTLALRRAHHDYRAAFVVESHDQAAEVLAAFAAEGSKTESSALVQDVALRPDSNKGLVWVFSGHGAQWRNMGKELLANPVFVHAVTPLDSIAQKEAGFSAVDALRSADFDEAESEKVQVLTYMMQIGLAAILRSQGVVPHAVIGHSVGEIAASVAAGCLTPEEGALIVCRRSQLYSRVRGQGAMFMVNLPFDQVKSELGNREDVVAAIQSSPSSCVISGKTEAVQAYVDEVKKRGVKAARVATDIAFHSKGMLSSLAAPLAEALVNDIQPRAAQISLYSTTDANPRADGLRDVDYWVRNMVNPVLLDPAVSAAVSDGFRVFVEVSSHPIVSHSISETIMGQGLDDEDFAVIPTLKRNKPTETSILHAVGSVYVKGGEVDFRKQLGRRWCLNVPGTQWAHKPIWRNISAPSASPAAILTHDVDKHTLLGLRQPVAGTNTVHFTTTLDNTTKPFPGSHPLHGSEIVPAAVLVNTFHHATSASTLSNIVLRVPVAINAARDVQVVAIDDSIKLVSRLSSTDQDSSWVTHTTGRFSASNAAAEAVPQLELDAIKQRIGAELPRTFSIDYLAQVGVSAMGFPWAVTEHHGNVKEMLARVDVAPGVAAAAALPWDAASWAPMLDAATSVGSTLFFDQPRLRMPAQIEQVRFLAPYGTPPPKTGYLHVQDASERGAPAVHVSVCDEGGTMLVTFESMRFSEIEGTPGVSGSVESLVHTLAWVPAPFANTRAAWDRVVLVSDDADTLARCGTQLRDAHVREAGRFSSAGEVMAAGASSLSPSTAIIYCPGPVDTLADVPAKSEAFIAELLALAKHVVRTPSLAGTKLFALTTAVCAATSPTALAHAPLYGLARIIAAEHPDAWGALLDVDDNALPTLALKYVHDQDVIRVEDGLPRVARLQPLPRSRRLAAADDAGKRSLRPTPAGTYLITGGLGALGLEVAGWLVEKGARRVVLVSRRGLPARSEWRRISADHPQRGAIERVQALEEAGATVHALALDVGAAGAQAKLTAALDALGLPAVRGIVHAAGTLEDQLVLDVTGESVERVLRPKVAGALALHAAFPPCVLDFFVLFSSCGQLFGFPGQASYAAGNAFLDALAAYRRGQGDVGAVAFQWTSWRGQGMAASTDFIAAELEGKGITDISVDEAFRAWEHVGRYDVDHAVVLRSLAFEAGEPLPSPILEDIVVWKSSSVGSAQEGSANAEEGDGGMPARGGPELKAWLDTQIRDIIAGVLMLSGGGEVDQRAAIADLGVDSVMTVTLRRKLQATLKVKVPPTLLWSHPTTNHLVSWFVEKLEKNVD